MASGDYVVGRDIDFFVSSGPPRPAPNVELVMNLPTAAKKKARKRAKKKKGSGDQSLDFEGADSTLFSGSAGEYTDRNGLLPLWNFDPSVEDLAAVPAQIKRLKRHQFPNTPRKTTSGVSSILKVEDVVQYRTKLEAEHAEIQQFWQNLNQKQREALVRIDRAEIFDVIHMERRECDCELCESKKDAIDAELDALFDVNYPVIEQYMNRLLAGELTLTEEANMSRGPECNKTGMSFHELRALNFRIPRTHNEYSEVHGSIARNDASDALPLNRDAPEAAEGAVNTSKRPKLSDLLPCLCPNKQCSRTGAMKICPTSEKEWGFDIDNELATLCPDEYMQNIIRRMHQKLTHTLTSSILGVDVDHPRPILKVAEQLAAKSEPEAKIVSDAANSDSGVRITSSGSSDPAENSVDELTTIEATNSNPDGVRPESNTAEPNSSLELSSPLPKTGSLPDDELDKLADDMCNQLGFNQEKEKNLIQLITGMLPLFTVKDLTEEDRYQILSRLMESGIVQKDLFFDMIAHLATDLLGNNGSEIIEAMESLQKSNPAATPSISEIEPGSEPAPDAKSSENSCSKIDSEQDPESTDESPKQPETPVISEPEGKGPGGEDPEGEEVPRVGDQVASPDSDSNLDETEETQHPPRSQAEQEVHDYYSLLKGETAEETPPGAFFVDMGKKPSDFDIEVEISESSDETSDIPEAFMYDHYGLKRNKFDEDAMDVNHPLHEYFPDYTGSDIERTLPPDHANHTPLDTVGTSQDQDDTTLLNEDDILIDKEQRRLAKASWYLQNLYARIFEVRVLTTYREHVAKMRQRLLLAELAAEEERANNEALRKAREKDKKKSKKLLAKQLRQEEEKKKALEEKKKQDALKAKEEARRIQQLEMDRAKQEAHRRKIEKRMAQLELNSRNTANSTAVSPQYSPKKDPPAGNKEPLGAAKKDDPTASKPHENGNLPSSGSNNKTPISKPVPEKPKTETSKIPKTDALRSESSSRASDQSRLDKERIKLERQVAKKTEKLEKLKVEKSKLDRGKLEKAVEKGVEKALARPKPKATDTATDSFSNSESQETDNADSSQLSATIEQPTTADLPEPASLAAPKPASSTGATNFAAPNGGIVPPGMSPQPILGLARPQPHPASVPISLETGLSSNIDLNAAPKNSPHVSRGMLPLPPFGFPPPGMGGIVNMPGMRREPHGDMIPPPGMAPITPMPPGGRGPLGPHLPTNLNPNLGANIGSLNGVRGIAVNLGGNLAAKMGPNISTNMNNSGGLSSGGNVNNGSLSLHPAFPPSGLLPIPNKGIPGSSPMNVPISRPSVPLSRGLNSPSQSSLPKLPGMSNVWAPVSGTASPNLSAPPAAVWNRSVWTEPSTSEGKSSPNHALGSSPWSSNNRKPSESEVIEAARKSYHEVKNLGVDGLVPSQVLFHAAKSKLAVSVTQQDLFRALAADKSAKLVRDDVGLVTHIKL